MTLGPGRNVLSSGRYVAYDGSTNISLRLARLLPGLLCKTWTCLLLLLDHQRPGVALIQVFYRLLSIVVHYATEEYEHGL